MFETSKIRKVRQETIDDKSAIAIALRALLALCFSSTLRTRALSGRTSATPQRQAVNTRDQLAAPYAGVRVSVDGLGSVLG